MILNEIASNIASNFFKIGDYVEGKSRTGGLIYGTIKDIVVSNETSSGECVKFAVLDDGFNTPGKYFFNRFKKV